MRTYYRLEIRIILTHLTPSLLSACFERGYLFLPASADVISNLSIRFTWCLDRVIAAGNIVANLCLIQQNRPNDIAEIQILLLDFCVMFCRSLFVLFDLFLLAIVLSVFLQFTASECPFGILKLVILHDCTNTLKQ